MYNKVILIGNLTRDVELRYLPSGTAVSKIGLATNRRYKNQMGEQKDETCFIDVSFFGRTAEIANQYLKKGSKILVEGRLVLEQWTDQSGQKRSKHSITAENMQMLDTKAGSMGQFQDGNRAQIANENEDPYMDQYKSYNNQSQNYNQDSNNNQNSRNIPEIDIDDDEIPF